MIREVGTMGKNMMNKKAKKLWIDALRSGKYEQGYGQLCDNGKYCCLGVLVDIAISHDSFNDGFKSKRDDYWKKLDRLPVSVADWAGLEETDPCLREGDIWEYEGRASNLNDDGVDFDEIADLIERNL